MAKSFLTATRIGEIKNQGRKTLSDRDLDELVILALDQPAQASARAQRDQEFEALRTSLDEESKRLLKSAGNYADAARALTFANRDLTATDNYVHSLARRLQDSLATEKKLGDWHEAFLREVHNCIDHKPLSPVAQLNSTLLRLQEALEPDVAVK